MKIAEMLKTHPRRLLLDEQTVRPFLEAATECAQTCSACADACLGEQDVQSLVRCVRLNLDCADVCTATARLFSRQTESDPVLLRAQLEACQAACRACAEECEKHASHHEHCLVCGESCRDTGQLAGRLASSLTV